MPEGNRKEILNSYWEALHGHYSSGDALRPVINPEASDLINRLYNYGHWRGMREAFKRLGDLRGKSVLDIGCGRGRWSREFARRGAVVLGIDWSQEAVKINQEKIPECTFAHVSVLELNKLGSSGFDVINSVTVIQHTPREYHAKIFQSIYGLLNNGGAFTMLESIFNPVLRRPDNYRDGACTFYWSKDEWISLAEKSGFRLVHYKGCIYKPLLRLYDRLTRPPSQVLSAEAAAVATSTPSAFKHLLTLSSFPVEGLSSILPGRWATHGLFVFEKRGV